MKRPLTLVLAAALAAGTMAITSVPASAQGVGITFGVGNWNNDRWHYDDNGYGHHRHHRHHNYDHVAPGFYMNFGVANPGARAYYHQRHHYYRNRDCWRQWDGAVVCSY